MNSHTNYILIFFSLLTLQVSKVNTFQITPLKRFEPIHARQTDSVRLFCRNQIIQYDIEMRDMTFLNRKLTTTVNTLDDICGTIQFNHICTFTIDEIKFLISALINKNQYLKTMNARATRLRSTDEFGEIIQKTIILADNSYGELRHSLDELQSLINQIGKSQNKILEHLDYVNFNALAQITILNLKTFSQMYDSIMEIFINQNYKKLADLIPIESLKTDLKTIQKLAKNESCEVPINIASMNLLQLLSISRIDSRKSGNTFSIKITISTAYEKIFDLIEATSMPFLYRKNSYLMLPVHDSYLMYSDKQLDNVNLIPFTLEDKLNCKKLTDFLLCNPRENSMTTKPYALTNFFIPNPEFCDKTENLLKITSNPQLCNVKMTLHLNRIIKLTDTKYYIYAITPTNISIKCIHQNYTQTILEPSLIDNLNTNCSIGFEHSDFYERRQTETNVSQKSSYTFPIYSFVANDLIKKERSEYEFKQSKDLQPEFGSLQEKIRKYNHEMTKNRDQSKSEIPKIVPIFIALLIATAIIIFIFSAYKCYYRVIRIPRTSIHMNTLSSESNANINV